MNTLRIWGLMMVSFFYYIISLRKTKIDLSDTIIAVNQDQIETVIPALDREMLIVNGAYADNIGVLFEILEEKFCVRLKIKQGPNSGRMVDVAYEDASKYKKVGAEKI